MKELSKEEQIEVLRAARINLKLSKVSGETFLCTLIGVMLISHTGHFIPSESIERYIPLFTRKNAVRICREHKILQPNSPSVWWVYTSLDKMIKARSRFLGALIKEIQNNG